MHETHIVFKNLSNINGDMLQKAWGLNFGEGSIINVLTQRRADDSFAVHV